MIRSWLDYKYPPISQCPGLLIAQRSEARETTMALAYHLSSFQGLTRVGVVESYVALRLDLFPKDTLDRVKMVAGVLFANYTFTLIFWLGVYPRFFHPLRHIRGPKVQLPRYRC